MVEIKFKKLRDNFVLPSFKKEGDAGADLNICAFKDSTQLEYVLKPLERECCWLGFSTEIPKGFYARVVPRSGLALNEGLTILNTPGTIDSGYRGEWSAIVVNVSNKEVKLKIGDRIAQMIVEKQILSKFKIVEELSETERGAGGFGSTGKQ